jgi:hypothetical protein
VKCPCFVLEIACIRKESLGRILHRHMASRCSRVRNIYDGRHQIEYGWPILLTAIGCDISYITCYKI